MAWQICFQWAWTIEEFIEVNEKKVLEVKRGRLQIYDEEKGSESDLGALRFNGSSLRFLDEGSLPQSLIRLKSAMRNIKSLSFFRLRQCDQFSDSDFIGSSGEYLAGFLFTGQCQVLCWNQVCLLAMRRLDSSVAISIQRSTSVFMTS